MRTPNILWTSCRYVGAIIVASLVGEIVAVPAALFIDIVAGAEVTGGRDEPKIIAL